MRLLACLPAHRPPPPPYQPPSLRNTHCPPGRALVSRNLPPPPPPARPTRSTRNAPPLQHPGPARGLAERPGEGPHVHALRPLAAGPAQLVPRQVRAQGGWGCVGGGAGVGDHTGEGPPGRTRTLRVCSSMPSAAAPCPAWPSAFSSFLSAHPPIRPGPPAPAPAPPLQAAPAGPQRLLPGPPHRAAVPGQPGPGAGAQEAVDRQLPHPLWCVAWVCKAADAVLSNRQAPGACVHVV